MPTLSKLTEVIDDIIEAESDLYTNHPNDRGGPTKYGITLKTLRSLPFYAEADADDVKHLTRDKAVEIYRSIYAETFLLNTDDTIFNFGGNAGVQHGVAGATKQLQRALGLEDDGVIGPMTKAEVERVLKTLEGAQRLLAKLAAERCKYYAKILQNDHSQRVFASGWLNRVAKDLS